MSYTKKTVVKWYPNISEPAFIQIALKALKQKNTQKITKFRLKISKTDQILQISIKLEFTVLLATQLGQLL